MKWNYNIFVFLILVLLFTIPACSSTPVEKQSEEKSSITKPVEKAKPKTLSFNLGEIPSFDPAYADTMVFANVGQGIFEGLVKYKEGSTEIEPDLATSWDISPDMKTYKFYLRKGVKFHDGSIFNADSVLYSFNRQMKDKRTDDMVYAGFIFDPITKIEKIDDYTLSITLSNPQVTFLTNLAMYFGSPIISSESHKKDPAAFAQNPIGTGPYKLFKHEKDKYIELEINKDYWGTKPKIDNIHIDLVETNFQDLTNALSNGKIDFLHLYNQQDINKLNLENITIAKTESANTYYIAYNCLNSIFKNKDFREGVSHLINKNELLKSYSDAYGEKAETLIPPSIFGFSSKVKSYDFDLSKAKELLKNFPKDKEISIIYNFETSNVYAEFIKNSLEQVGLKSKLEFIDDSDDRFKDGIYDISIQGWQSDNGDPDNFVFILETTSIENNLNYARYSNAEFDTLVNKGRTTFNNDVRREIYKQVEDIIARDVPILPLYHSGIIYAYSKKLKNFYKQPTGVLRFMNFDKD